MINETLVYELQLTIKEGVWISPCPNSAMYVETSVDGKIEESDKTSIGKISDHKVVWNKTITKRFSTLEPATPVMISLSMYKKRLFQESYKLIGTAHLNLYDLIPMLNKGTVQGRISLNEKKNHVAETHIVVAINLQSIPIPPSAVTPDRMPSNTFASSQVIATATAPQFECADGAIEGPGNAHRVSKFWEGSEAEEKNFMSTITQFDLLLVIIFISIITWLYQVLLD